MRRLRFLLSAAAAAAATPSSTRDYVADIWGTSLYRLRIGEALDGVGLVNDESIYVASRTGISTLRNGQLTRFLEVTEGELTAFHLCQHRSSFFFEVELAEGGGLSLFEYSLVTRTKMHVRDFQDIPPATSLACLDRLLLRTSASSLLGIMVQGGEVSVLREFSSGITSSDAISSVSVRYPADLYTRAEVYAAVPSNRTLLRLRLAADGVGLPNVWSWDVILAGGDGSDGKAFLGATVRSPRHVVWLRDRVIFSDGCSLRELEADNVRTLLGAPSDCAEHASEELIEPVPWATRITRLTTLAATGDGTASTAILALTAGQVLRVAQGSDDGTGPSQCSAIDREATCVHQHGCGWAEGDSASHRLCLDCASLQHWAHDQACDLEHTIRSGTRYSLAGCGCEPHPQPVPRGDVDDDDIHHRGIWAVLIVLALFGAAAGTFLMYRKQRRVVGLNHFYGNDDLDTAEFHTFTDDDCGNA